MFILNRRGFSRTVILTKKYAFKFPNFFFWKGFLHGLLGNMQEITWNAVNYDERLCPIKFYIPGGWLVVMPRVKQLTREEFINFDCEAFIGVAEKHIPVEAKEDSFGWLNNKIVAIDYGGNG